MIRPNPHETNQIAVLRSPHGRDDRFRERGSCGNYRRIISPPNPPLAACRWLVSPIVIGGPVERLIEMV
jgi:ribosomal protein S10